MRFKLGLLIGFGIGWLAGKDVLLTFFQGLRKTEGSSARSTGSGHVSSFTGTSAGSGAANGNSGATEGTAGSAKAAG